MALIRLDKLLSAGGGVSRAEAKLLLRQGKVTVDGLCVTDGSSKVEDSACVCLDGAPVVYRTFTYLMMNKPTGVLSATEDPRQKTVLDLLPPVWRRLGLFPAGRLDKDAHGLLILTDDGAYCHNVISPKHSVWKRYLAVTEGRLLEEHCRRFEEGIVLADGLHCLPAGLEILESGERSRCIVTVREGKFHQVKRMLASCSCPVTDLKRLSIGGLHLDETLRCGEARVLTESERNSVFEIEKLQCCNSVVTENFQN